MTVRTYRGDYAPTGQFGWDGGAGTTTYADPENRLVGILLTQTGMSTPDSARAMQDFWTTLYQAIDDRPACLVEVAPAQGLGQAPSLS